MALNRIATDVGRANGVFVTLAMPQQPATAAITRRSLAGVSDVFIWICKMCMKPWRKPIPMYTLKAWRTIIFGLAACMASAQAEQYSAYSLRVARQKIEAAGANWRQTDAEVWTLAGINHFSGFVWDTATNDLILVGSKEAGRAALTLDDLAVALQARLRDNQWPLVSIDPPQVGGTPAMQPVRFEGGIRDTAFGQCLFDADFELKRMSMGLVAAGIPGFETEWDKAVKEMEVIPRHGPGRTEIASRFWFFPINPLVVVHKDVGVMRGLKIGVFTEVLSAKIDGKSVADLRGIKNANQETFASDVSNHFESLCQVHESLNRLRGLQELVALSKAIEAMEVRPDIDWWLRDYSVMKMNTPTEVKILQRHYQGQYGVHEASGGVHLAALALRLKRGDVDPLREAVITSRPTSATLSWSFVVADWVIPVSGDVGVSEVRRQGSAAFLQQALFVVMQGKYGEAIAIYDMLIKADPECTEAYCNRGFAYLQGHDLLHALADFDRAIELDPTIATAYNLRGAAFLEKRDIAQALIDFDKAITLNPNLAEAYANRGTGFDKQGLHDRAMVDFEKAIALSSKCAKIYLNRGLSFGAAMNNDRALLDFDKAIELDPCFADAYANRGVAFEKKGIYERALADYNRALEINPKCAIAYFNRGNIYSSKNDTARAISDYSNALIVNPAFSEAYQNRGNCYSRVGKTDAAIADETKCIEFNPENASAYYSRGLAYARAGIIGLAMADFDQAVTLNPKFALAYNNRAVLWLERNNYDKAWENVRRCVDSGGTPEADLLRRLRQASGRHE